MINCSVVSLHAISSQLMLEQLARTYTFYQRDGQLDEIETDISADKLQGWFRVAEECAVEFEMPGVTQRINAIRKKLKRGVTSRELGQDIRELRDLMQEGTIGQFLFRYDGEVSAVFRGWKEAWAPVLEVFPSAQLDVVSAVDLWALGHHTACVFHLMRVLEHGLRALAKDVGKTFEAQNWQVIIDQIEAETKSLGKTLPAGKAKGERLRFLATVSKEFTYFKDGWRNYVSHSGGFYSKEEARVVMDHVLQFMTGLAGGLSVASTP